MSMIRSKNSKLFGNGMAVKVLSVAAFVGLAFAVPACADDATQILLGDAVSAELLKNKPIDKPTLDYLRENNILIPQQSKWDSATNSWVKQDPITLPESAYKIVDGSKDNHTFEYQTADENGNITTTYYTIELKDSVLDPFGTSKNIIWKEVENAGGDTISVQMGGGY